jgi:hypothetical protein
MAKEDHSLVFVFKFESDSWPGLDLTLREEHTLKVLQNSAEDNI